MIDAGFAPVPRTEQRNAQKLIILLFLIARRVEETDTKLERELRKSKEELTDDEIYMKR